MARILAVPGIQRTGAEFRRALWDMAQRNGWDVDAIATVMSIESGFRAAIKNPQPNQTASGLIQMIDATARSLGIAGGAAQLRTMSDVEQLPYVEKYYQRAGLRAGVRRVDFYLAGWGSGIGASFAHVLARAGERTYELNKGLDANGNGEITVGDIDAKMAAQQAQARGQYVDAEPGGSTPPPLADAFLLARLRCLAALYGSLPVLEVGAVRGDVTLAIREFQRAAGLKVDDICGPKTWSMLLRGRS
jgi:peptidoglycan hydrolase-like protein with peptidoglycan-binding domain